MSRTFKDRPWWMRATWWKPVHLSCPHDTTSWRRHGTRRDCDLPDRPIYSRDAPTAGVLRRRGLACYWWPDTPWFRCTCSYCHPRYPSRDRAALAAFGRRARAEHRATGTVDVDFHPRATGPRWCDW